MNRRFRPRWSQLVPAPCPLGLCDGWGVVTVAGLTGVCLCLDPAPPVVAERLQAAIKSELERQGGVAGRPAAAVPGAVARPVVVAVARHRARPAHHRLAVTLPRALLAAAVLAAAALVGRRWLP